MSAARDPRVTLHEIRKYAANLVAGCEGRTFKDYQDDFMFRMAVDRAVEVVGEAAGRLTPQFRTDHSPVPSSQITGIRTRLAHEYDRLNPQIIWEVATKHFPKLIEQVDKILRDFPE